jgi:hypothetical protein
MQGGPLHNHLLGHAPVASSMAGWGGMHATTILAVRKGGRVVSVLLHAPTSCAAWSSPPHPTQHAYTLTHTPSGCCGRWPGDAGL